MLLSGDSILGSGESKGLLAMLNCHGHPKNVLKNCERFFLNKGSCLHYMVWCIHLLRSVFPQSQSCLWAPKKCAKKLWEVFLNKRFCLYYMVWCIHMLKSVFAISARRKIQYFLTASLHLMVSLYHLFILLTKCCVQNTSGFSIFRGYDFPVNHVSGVTLKN